MSFKSFIEEIGLNYKNLYSIPKYKTLRELLKIAYKNTKTKNTFTCDEEKIIHITQILKQYNYINKKSIPFIYKYLCNYVEKNTLKQKVQTSQKLTDNISKTDLEKITKNLKDTFIKTLAQILLINYQNIDNILTDNKLTSEKILLLPDLSVLKHEVIITLIKKIPLEKLKKAIKKYENGV